MTAITALTAQNTVGVNDIHYIPSEFVKKAINACVEDVGVDIVKTGELSNPSFLYLEVQNDTSVLRYASFCKDNRSGGKFITGTSREGYCYRSSMKRICQALFSISVF